MPPVRLGDTRDDAHHYHQALSCSPQERQDQAPLYGPEVYAPTDAVEVDW